MRGIPHPAFGLGFQRKSSESCEIPDAAASSSRRGFFPAEGVARFSSSTCQRGLLSLAAARWWPVAFVTALLSVLCAGQQPGDAGNVEKKAMALEQQGQYAEAGAEWRSFLRTQPDSAEGYAHLGFIAAQQQEYAEAIGFYRKAAAIDSRMPGLQLNLGLALLKSGDLRSAIESFQAALRSTGNSPADAERLQTLLGMAHYSLQQYALAIPYLKEAAQRDPQNLQLRMLLVQSCMETKKYECVLSAYHEMVLLNADSAEVDMLAGEALDSMNDGAAAEEQFRNAIAANPQEPNAHFGLGYLLWKRRDYDAAAEQFRAELVNTPNNAQTMAYLGDAQMHLQNSDAAIAVLQNAVGSDPNLALAHLDLGILYGEENRATEALEQLRMAEKLNPRDPGVHYCLGRLYKRMGQPTEAKLEFARCQNLQKAADDSIYEKLHGHSQDAAKE
jgi:tetratricopeptide (TPR) repeat protein